jgi:hypothetical protein
VPVVDGDDVWVVDEAGTAAPVAESHARWSLLALAAGHPVDVFGEWSTSRLWPLSVDVSGTLVGLR